MLVKPMFWFVALFSKKEVRPAIYALTSKDNFMLDANAISTPTIGTVEVVASDYRPESKVERANQKAAFGVIWKKRVRCSICKQLATRETSHSVNDKGDKHKLYIGDECCWATSESIKTVG